MPFSSLSPAQYTIVFAVSLTETACAAPAHCSPNSTGSIVSSVHPDNDAAANQTKTKLRRVLIFDSSGISSGNG